MTNRSFDREALVASEQCGGGGGGGGQCLLQLRIAAYAHAQGVSRLIVQPVEIRDVNDNEPVFRSRQYAVSVSENVMSTSYYFEMLSLFPLKNFCDFFAVNPLEYNLNLF